MSTNFTVVLIANDDHPIPSWVGERFAQAGITYVFNQCYSRKDLETCAADAEVLWLQSDRRGLITEDNMDIFDKVGAIVRVGSGTDNIDCDACTKRGIIVAHSPDDVVEATSDHAIALLFTVVRQIARQNDLVHQGIWNVKAAMPGSHFTGANVGLIGFGRIGRAIARKLSGYQMTIRVNDPYVDTSIMSQYKCKGVGLKQLLAESQFVIIVCPLLDETRGLIGEKEFQMMRQDSVVINCARGGIIDENSLYKALKEGRIRGAALDVIENPPLDKDHPLLSLINIVITPHIASYSSHYPDSLFVNTVQAIIDLSNRRMPQWVVNKNVKPKWKMSRSRALIAKEL